MEYTKSVTLDAPVTVLDVRYWHLADMSSAPHMSAFGGKADMTFCTANVCF